MIFAVGKGIPESKKYTSTTFQHFVDWIVVQKAYQLDVETNMTKTRLGRKLRTVQFGEVRTKFDTPGIRFVIHWNGISEQEKQLLLEIVAKRGPKKYIHNAIFEYEVFLNYNVVLENVKDTMLGEMEKWAGYQSIDDDEGNNFYSLAGCMNRYFNVLLDKTYQTLFVHEIDLTENHIVYAADDITHLDELDSLQTRFLKQEELINVQNLENEAVLAFGDITWNGIKIDPEKWMANLALAEPLVKQYKETLDKWLLTDPKLNAYAKKVGYIYTEDTVEFNINSPVHKAHLVKKLFPEMPGATKPIIKKYLKENMDVLSDEQADMLSAMFEQDWTVAFQYLIDNDRQWLIDNNYVVPAGTIRLNWNSRDQVLPMFQTIDKKLKDLSEKSRNTFEHPIVHDFEQYKNSLKLVSAYGQKFLDEHVDLDGRIRTRFNQILTTGRVSSSSPNMQQIPANDDVGNRYRNAFIPEPGWVFVDSDYSSQELVIIATVSQDPVWLRALAEGKDLHSIGAALIFGDKWSKVAEPGCRFVESEQKCSCKGHKSLRASVKELNFGLAYGMSKYKLAGSQKISVKAAEELMDKYFATFPAIGKLLTNLGGYAVQMGVIKTLAPFNRKRWFPLWDKVKAHIDEHLRGIRYNSILGSIERAGKNLPKMYGQYKLGEFRER